MEIYKSAQAPIEERVRDLLGRMTLKEKVGQLNQRMYGWNAYVKQGDRFELTEEFKAEVAWGSGMGALYGLFRSDPWSGVHYGNGITAAESAKVANQVQRYVMEHSRLGIPVLLTEECPHGHQALDGTLLPVNLAAGATWNPALLAQAYGFAAAEIRSRGAHVGLVSALDILHDPRWGRSEECYSEDPYLAARFTEAVVRGMQGERLEQLAETDKVAVVLKHLCAQGTAQGGRNAGPAPIGERELREIHLPAAKAGKEAGAAAFMAAYNEIDGVPCHANEQLLTGILREEWGFDGVVMADGCAIDRLLALTGSHESAAALALASGVDLSLWDKAFTTLEEAVYQALVPEPDIDRAVERVLRLKFRLGLFDRPYVNENGPIAVVGRPEFREVNRQVALESAVLLKNEGGLLPIRKKHRRIAVIGPNADQLYNQLGDYTSVQREGSGTTVLAGIRMAAPAETDIVYAKGCGIRDRSEEGLAEAVEAAKSADLCVLVLGGSSARRFDGAFESNGEAIVPEGDAGNPSEMDCGEGVDLADLSLGGLQQRLVQEVSATGTPVVAVLIQGRPHAITEVAQHCGAVLCAWYPGPEGGAAVGQLLFGQANPSGKLPVSIPRSAAQLPVYYNQKDPGRPRVYVDMPSAPLYPFGYGLSYTAFEYGEIRLSQRKISVAELAKGGQITAAVRLKNTGECTGAETVQLYISARESGITRRLAELKGFRKLELAPGEEREVTFHLGMEELAFWNRAMKFTAEPCAVRIGIGGSSQDLSHAELRITESV